MAERCPLCGGSRSLRLSDPEARADVEQLEREITSTPEKAREFLIQCGLLTADGKRSPNFYPDDPDGVALGDAGQKQGGGN